MGTATRDQMTETQYGSLISILSPNVKQDRLDELLDAARRKLPPPDPHEPHVERSFDDVGRDSRCRRSGVCHGGDGNLGDGGGRRGRRRVEAVSRKQEVMLRRLHACCRDANYDDIMMVVRTHPNLLLLTDRWGWTALHHAVMSENLSFIVQVLNMYREPRAFTRNSVTYDCEEDVRRDGIRLCWGRFVVGPKLESSAVLVGHVEPRSASAANNVRVGDMLESVGGDKVVKNLTVETLQKAPSPPEMIAVTDGKCLDKERFPITLCFARPAHAEILVRNTWTFLDRAAAMGERFEKIRSLLSRERAALTATTDELRLLDEACSVSDLQDGKRACAHQRSKKFAPPSPPVLLRGASHTEDAVLRLPALARAVKSEPSLQSQARGPSSMGVHLPTLLK